jgi:hypothetical protein
MPIDKYFEMEGSSRDSDVAVLQHEDGIDLEWHVFCLNDFAPDSAGVILTLVYLTVVV